MQQYLYHDFAVEEGTGPVLLGEVSQCNDDNTDNRFNPPVGRFPEIEEDEDAYEYTKYTEDSGNIVYVEYENGTYFILNYNYFAVDVVFDGVTHRIAAYGGVKVVSGAEPIYFTTTK